MAYSKEYYQKHKEQYKENNKKWIEKNREKFKESQKKWYQENKEEIYRKQREYQKANKKRFSELCQNSRRRKVQRLREQGVKNAWAVVVKGEDPKYGNIL